jgi:hypothetical protein
VGLIKQEAGYASESVWAFSEKRKTSSQIDVIVGVIKLNATTLVCTAYGYEVSAQVKLMLYAC